MAKIVVQFDTITKEAEVTLDGQNIEKVSEVTFYIYQDDNKNIGYVDITSTEYIEDQKIMKTTRISADKQEVIAQESDTDTIRKELSAAISKSFGS